MPGFEPMCRIQAQVGALLTLGDAPVGERRVVPILGGVVTGQVSGTIVPGGADWQLRRADGVLEIAAHYAIRADDGGVIEVVSEGYRHGPPEVMARLAAGEDVPPEAYFFRTAIRFRTGAPAHAALNRTLAFATARRGPDHVQLDVFRLL